MFSRLPWAVCALALFACDDQAVEATAPVEYGQMRSAIAGAGVAAARVDIFSGEVVVESHRLTMESIALPGEPERPVGDVYTALPPGAYRVQATALNEDGDARRDCSQASANANVVGGETVEVRLTLVCGGDETGGLDTLVTVEHAPTIDDLRIDPSKLTKVCRPVLLQVSATDPDDEPLTYEWRVLGPDDAPYDLQVAGSVASFMGRAVASYTLEVVVSDPAGHETALTFPVHVGEGDGARCPARPQPKSSDDAHGAVAAVVPAFAGVHLGPDGETVLSLTDVAEPVVAAAIDAVADHFDGRIDMADVRVEAVAFGFAELQAARVSMREAVLSAPGAVSISVDERGNAVRIRVEDELSEQLVGNIVGALGVDPAMVRIVARGPIAPLVMLTDDVRPNIGGLQIQRAGGGTCTLGFLAVRGGGRGFVTNAHCTAVRGMVEGTVHHQATVAGDNSNRISVEVADPPHFTGGGCPSGRQCRFSDSAFSLFDAGVRGRRGDIAKPWVGAWNGLHIFDGPFPGSYKIRNRVSFPVCGERLHKVGRTTGHTQGDVDDTCVDVNSSGSNFTYLCQDLVEANSAGGDSGSPVFRRDDVYDVTLAGVLWGGSGGEFVFSPLGGVTRGTELGAMGVGVANDPPTVDITSHSNGDHVAHGGFNETTLVAVVDDFENGPNCCDLTWSTDVDGVIGQGTQIEYIFPTPGARTVTVTATEGNIHTVTDSVLVVAGNTPPQLFINNPSPGEVLTRNTPYVFSGTSFDSETFQPLPCVALTWTSSNVNDPFPAVGCNPQVAFPTNGPRVITLTGIDNLGAQGSTAVGINVVAAPAAGPPAVTILTPNAFQGLAPAVFVNLSGTANDPDDNGPIQYQWVVVRNGNETVIGQTAGPDGGQSQLFWRPADHVPPSCGGSVIDLELRATDGDGQTGVDSIELTVMYPPC